MTDPDSCLPDVYLPEDLPPLLRAELATLVNWVPDIRVFLGRPDRALRLHLANGRQLDAFASQANIYALWCAPIGTLPGQTCELDTFALTRDRAGRLLAVHITLPIFHHVVNAEMIVFDSRSKLN